jgi:hypothetical protein
MNNEQKSSVEPKWTAIPGYPGYGASKDGSIWSLDSNWRGMGARRLAPSDKGDGYPIVRVYCNGKRVGVAVHKLVCLAFHGPRPSESHEVRHLDGSRSNSCPENLAWGTRKENAQDRTLHGNTVRGERIFTARLTPNDVLDIRARYRKRGGPLQSGAALGREYGVTPENIVAIAKRKTWRHV